MESKKILEFLDGLWRNTREMEGDVGEAGIKARMGEIMDAEERRTKRLHQALVGIREGRNAEERELLKETYLKSGAIEDASGFDAEVEKGIKLAADELEILRLAQEHLALGTWKPPKGP